MAGTDAVGVPVVPHGDEVALGPGAAELLEEAGVDLFEVLQRAKGTGKAGEVAAHAAAVGPDGQGPIVQVLLVGVGTGAPADLRRAGAALARRTKGRRTLATSVAALADDAGLGAFVEGLVLGSYVFSRRSQGPLEAPVEQVVLTGLASPDQRRDVLERALAVARAGWLARTLALVPSNEKNPAWMADRAVEIAGSAGLQVRVWQPDRMARDGFGAILAVGRASASPPRLIQLAYRPGTDEDGAAGVGRRVPHVVLVGKAITFDTGGLSLKPADAMVNMKRDMTGGGAVLAVFEALAGVDCPVRVTGLLPCAENAVGGNAMRPGDVVRHYGGRTTEVTNTDAEGRLVLADAIAYAVAELDPDVVVDVATLTGAMRVALGQRTGGLFSTDDALAGLLTAAGEAAGEPVWRLPLVDDYEDRLQSKVADADNAGGQPGGITGALFLRPFAGSVPWAHLDLASVGDSPTDSYEWTQGATGFGARLLLHWLGLRDPLAGVGAAGSASAR